MVCLLSLLMLVQDDLKGVQPQWQLEDEMTTDCRDREEGYACLLESR